MNVAHLLVGQVSQRPNAPAIIEGSGRHTRQISFAELDAMSAQCAGLLAASGVNAGDAVLVFVPMSIDLYLALIAIFRVGAVATFLDPSAGRDHIRRCCEMVRPTAMIAISKAHLLRLTCPALRRIPHKFSVGWPVPGAVRWTATTTHVALSRIAPRSPDDAALLTFTSGSTGNPKAAVRTHGLLAAQHAALARAIDLCPGEVDLATLPIFSLANLASGVTTVIADADLRRPGQIDPMPVLRQICEHHITRSVASPALFERLLNVPNASASLATLTQIYTGGAPVFPRLLHRLRRAMPASRIVAVYGSTEAEPIAHVARDEIAPEDLRAMFDGAGLLAGLPVEEIDLRIIPNQWGDPLPPMTAGQFSNIVLSANSPGEIVVHGAHVLRGYLNGVGDETTKFRVEDQVWHRTGDAGYLDDRGRLWLLGRAEAKIQDEHGEIYPFAVECAASQFDEIARSALIQHEGKRMLVVELNPRILAPGRPEASFMILARTFSKVILRYSDGSTCFRRTRRSSGVPQDDSSANFATQQNENGSPDTELGLKLFNALAWAKIGNNWCFVDSIPVDKRHNAKIDYPALRKILTGH